MDKTLIHLRNNWEKWLLGLLLAGSGTVGAATMSSVGSTAGDSQFQLVTGLSGYVSKPDPTMTAENYLISGSQNVIINDQEKVESRAGFELFGQASTTSSNPIKSDFSWKNSSGEEIILREVNGTLEYFATSTWEILKTGLATSSASMVRYATIWDNYELIDELLMVNASTTLMEWSGAQATFASSTSVAIGANELASSTNRFLLSGTRQIRVKDTSGIWRTFTYTTQSGATFSGVTPDPTSFTFEAGAPIVQAVRDNVNTPSSGFASDTIKVLGNQVWLGSATSHYVYISKTTSFTNYSKSSPRLPGDGDLLTMDAPTIGFASPDDVSMFIFSGQDRVYKVTPTISSGASADRENMAVSPVIISAGQGAKSAELIGKMLQSVVWVDNNNELVELAQVQNLPGPQAVAISDPIKPDFLVANFTYGEIEFWRNNLLITAPADGKTFIFDMAKRFWQPPQLMSIRRLSQYGGELYGHGNDTAETYHLFTGLNDNGNTIGFKAHFAYRNSGRRDALKNFDRYFTELYIGSNTLVHVKLIYEWQGAKQIQEYDLDGSVQDFLFTPSSNASLGVNSLGTNPLGGSLLAAENTPKYRRFKPTVPVDYFEYQARFESDSEDGAFQILSHGANTRISNNFAAKITK